MVLLACTCVVFVFLTFGVGPACIPPGSGSPLLRLNLGIGAGLTGTFLAGFCLYVTGLPATATHGVMVAAVALLWWRRRVATELWTDPDVRRVAWLWLAVAAWLLALELSIVNFSGGGWAGDWAEHYERGRFFAEHWPVDHLFLFRYPLAARPPLLNVVTAFTFDLTGVNFGVFQTLMVLTASLVLWPVVLLQRAFARTAGVSASPAWAAGLLMALPAFVQQATFLWTKLQAAFFVLLALALLRDASVAAAHRRRLVLLALSAAGLGHFSAAPWIVGLGVALVAARPAALRELKPLAFLRDALPAIALALPWFAWSSARLGWSRTFGSNTSLSPGMELSWPQRLEFMATNFRGTLLPAPLRGDGLGTVFSAEPISRFRDDFFNQLQNNLPLLAGATGFAVALWLLARNWPRFSAAQRRFGGTLIAVAVALGIATHSTPNPDGVANISLVPLALLAVAWNAALAPSATAPRRLLLAGVSFDVLLGVLLHFGVQSLLLLRLAYPDLDDVERIGLVGQPAWVNLQYAHLFQTPFLSGQPGAGVTALLLGAVACTAFYLGSRPSLGRDDPAPAG